MNTRTWPGSKGFRLTRAKECAVVKKTWECQPALYHIQLNPLEDERNRFWGDWGTGEQ